MGVKDGNKNCLNVACYEWVKARDKAAFEYAHCSRCGFNVKEAARREHIPLRKRADGLRRKIIRRGEA